MATHDTDPLTSPPPIGDDDGATAPGSPPEVTDEDVDAAALIAGLGGAPLPEQGVRETAGHVAAAMAVSAHAPRRAHELRSEAAVVLNTTEPLPRAIARDEARAATVDPAAMPVRPALRAAPRIHTTAPSARVAARRRSVVIATLAVAALAGTFVALALRARVQPTSSRAVTAPSALDTAGSKGSPLPSAASALVETAPSPDSRPPTSGGIGMPAATAPSAAAIASARSSAHGAPSGAIPPLRASAGSASTSGAPSKATPTAAATTVPVPASAHAPPATAAPPSTGAGDFPWRQ